MVATVRDVAIILLAVESLIIGVLLSVLLWQLRNLSRMLEEEVKPLLDSANETVGTVRGTSTFLSETVVSPVVRIISTVTGLRRGLGVLSGIRRRDEETES
ncbi:MAG: hypothetical protein ABIK79_04455 [Chloroflexota bacterium]|nr:hypothetical protein [Anaerolineae bacterium]